MTNKLSLGASQKSEAIMRKLGTFCQVIYCSRGIIAHHYTSNIASQMIYRQVRMRHKTEITSGRRLTQTPNCRYSHQISDIEVSNTIFTGITSLRIIRTHINMNTYKHRKKLSHNPTQPNPLPSPSLPHPHRVAPSFLPVPPTGHDTHL